MHLVNIWVWIKQIIIVNKTDYYYIQVIKIGWNLLVLYIEKCWCNFVDSIPSEQETRLMNSSLLVVLQITLTSLWRSLCPSLRTCKLYSPLSASLAFLIMKTIFSWKLVLFSMLWSSCLKLSLRLWTFFDTSIDNIWFKNIPDIFRDTL